MIVLYVLLSAVVLDVLFVAGIYDDNIKETERVAIALAEAACAGISKTDLSALTGVKTDIGTPGYEEIKNNLALIVKRGNMRFANLFVLRDGTVFFAADSEPAGSPYYSPPGTEYGRADGRTAAAFQNRDPIVTGPATDRRGKLVSVLVPVENPESHEIIAVFGVDYDAESWNNKAFARTLQTNLLILFLFAIIGILLVVFRQNTNLKREKAKLTASEAKLTDSERSKSVLLGNLPGMAYRCLFDREYTIEYASEGCMTLTGYPPESLLGNRDLSFNDLIRTEYREYLWTKYSQAVRDKTRFTEEYEIVTANGEIKWVWEQGQAVYDASGQPEALEGLIIDITGRKRNELMLNHLNYHDQLTGLYNRRYFETVISREKSDYHDDPGIKKAVLLVSVRNFSLLSATYGYVYSENLIRELASGLARHQNENRMLFHISVDRFILYIARYEHKSELIGMCRSLISTLGSVLSPGIVGANIGAVEITEPGCEPECIIKNASFAAEKAGVNQNFGYCFYNAGLAEKAERENEIKSELAAAALGNGSGSLYMMYQPVLDLRSDKISGFEALVRFYSEKFGSLSPAEFIPLAEESHLIVPLGNKIMRMVCLASKHFAAVFAGRLLISFNVSVIQLLRDDFLMDLTDVLEETGADPENLCIELTESFFSGNYRELNEKLRRIRKPGIKIAIDDFGTGYSSLAIENELETDYLKIDRYFIEKLMDCDTEKSITGDIISLGHKLGRIVIAEGVEHEKQKEYLSARHCDKIQGYLCSPPLSEEDAAEFVRTRQA